MALTEHDMAAASAAREAPANTRDTLTALTRMPPETLLSERALAQCLCVAGKTIRRMSVRGDIPKPLRIGKRKYWKAGFVASWIDQLAQRAQSESERLLKMRQDFA